MAIAALAVWAFTAAAGAYLLTHVIAAKRADGHRPVAGVPAAATVPAPAAPAPAAPVARAASPPPIPRTKVTAGPDDHPLREFSHPALGGSGLACWLAFVATHDLAFAWIACGVLAATAGIGLSWLVSNVRAAQRRGGTGTSAGEHAIGEHATGEHGAGGHAVGDHSAGGHAADRQDAGGRDAGGLRADRPGPGGRGAGQPPPDRQRVPAHLIAVHGLAAATTIALVVVTVVTTAHA